MRLTQLRWLILGLLFLSTVINYLDRQALSVLLPTLRADLGLTSTDYGTITMVFMLAYTVAQLGAGMVVDKIGTRAQFRLLRRGLVALGDGARLCARRDEPWRVSLSVGAERGGQLARGSQGRGTLVSGATPWHGDGGL